MTTLHYVLLRLRAGPLSVTLFEHMGASPGELSMYFVKSHGVHLIPGMDEPQERYMDLRLAVYEFCYRLKITDGRDLFYHLASEAEQYRRRNK